MTTQPTNYIAGFSYGKDSTRMLQSIKELGLPLTHIVTVDIYFDEDHLAYHDDFIEYRKYADAEIKKRYGLDVIHISSGKTFKGLFYKIKQKGKFVGENYGFPLSDRPYWCTSDLKREAITKFSKTLNGGTKWYIGYAIDEKNNGRQQRIKKCTDLTVFPLVMQGLTEQDCLTWCRENNLLAPTYDQGVNRDGCWFCNKQPLARLKWLHDTYPDKWQILKELQKDSPRVKYKESYTVDDLEKRFELEDKRLKEGLSITNRDFYKELKFILK